MNTFEQTISEMRDAFLKCRNCYQLEASIYTLVVSVSPSEEVVVFTRTFAAVKLALTSAPAAKSAARSILTLGRSSSMLSRNDANQIFANLLFSRLIDSAKGSLAVLWSSPFASRAQTVRVTRVALVPNTDCRQS